MNKPFHNHRFQTELTPLIKDRAGILMLLAGCLFPIFGLVDFILYPGIAPRFMGYRIITAALCFIFYAANRKSRSATRSLTLAFGTSYAAAVCLIVMIVSVGGYSTPYYAGLILLFLVICVILIADPKTILLHSLIQYAMYLGAVIGLSEPGSVSVFLANNAFLLTSLLIGMIAARNAWHWRYQDFIARARLTEARKQADAYAVDLESLIARTRDRNRRLIESTEEAVASLAELSIMSQQTAGDAGKLMREAQTAIRASDGTLETLSGRMRAISEASQKTIQIVQSIDEFAFQTNILALNAAVESARAGEAGAGFAVVAAEIRSLSAKAAEAARTTAARIEETVHRVREGETLGGEMNRMAGNLLESAQKVAELVERITEISEKQDEVLRRIKDRFEAAATDLRKE